MTPEQLSVVAPSVVAIAIALISAFVQWRSHLADNRRLITQREADDKRWTDQRLTDEARWKTQLQAEESKSASEHERLLELKELENRDKQAKGRMERLRSDAAEFVTLFEEAIVTTRAMSEQFTDAFKKSEWHRAEEIVDPWRNSDLPVKLSVATAKMRLHGPSVGAPASEAHENLREGIQGMSADLARCVPSQPWYILRTVEDSFRTSIEAVVQKLGESELPPRS